MPYPPWRDDLIEGTFWERNGLCCVLLRRPSGGLFVIVHHGDSSICSEEVESREQAVTTAANLLRLFVSDLRQ